MRRVDLISKVPFILKIYGCRGTNPETCFIYLLVCPPETCNRNCHVGNFELIFQHFSQYLDFRSCHNAQLLPVIIILWISGSPAKLVWDKPEPRRKRHIYFSYHPFSDLSYSHKNPSKCVILKCSERLVAEVKSHDKRWKQITM